MISNLFRNLIQGSLGYLHRLMQSQVRTTFLIEESRMIAELREQASSLEQSGNHDLAKTLRERAERLVANLGCLYLLEDDEQETAGCDERAKIVLSANVMPGSSSGALFASSEGMSPRRGRPKKPRVEEPPKE